MRHMYIKKKTCLTQDENWIISIYNSHAIERVSICKIPEMDQVYFIDATNSKRVISISEDQNSNTMERVIALSFNTHIELWSCLSDFTELHLARTIQISPEDNDIYVTACRLTCGGRILIAVYTNHRIDAEIKIFDTTTGELYNQPDFY